ncbi:MAG: glycosyltransferase, partial [Rickettsiales bacterium]|nr:glycosyltransferase [Rickettsiales bacterium]
KDQLRQYNAINNHLQSNYSNIKLLLPKCNIGLSNSRNIILSRAIGKYITFVDDDDMICEDGILNIFNETDNKEGINFLRFLTKRC